MSTFLTLNIKKIDKNNGILLSFRLQSVREMGEKSMEEKDPISHNDGSASSGDKHWEGGTYEYLGNAYFRVGYFKEAIEHHNLHHRFCLPF